MRLYKLCQKSAEGTWRERNVLRVIRGYEGAQRPPKVSGKHKLATGFYANLSIMHEPRLAALMRFPTHTHTLTHTHTFTRWHTRLSQGVYEQFLKYGIFVGIFHCFVFYLFINIFFLLSIFFWQLQAKLWLLFRHLRLFLQLLLLINAIFLSIYMYILYTDFYICISGIEVLYKFWHAAYAAYVESTWWARWWCCMMPKLLWHMLWIFGIWAAKHFATFSHNFS